MRKTGVELIAQERQEQIEKHGYDYDHDAIHVNGELESAAKYLLTGKKKHFPKNWDVKFFNMMNSKRNLSTINDAQNIDRLKIAGAFIAAEIDRIQCRR